MDCQKVVSVLCAHCKNRCDEYYNQIKNKTSGISYIESVHAAKRDVNQTRPTTKKFIVDINAR